MDRHKIYCHNHYNCLDCQLSTWPQEEKILLHAGFVLINSLLLLCDFFSHFFCLTKLNCHSLWESLVTWGFSISDSVFYSFCCEFCQEIILFGFHLIFLVPGVAVSAGSWSMFLSCSQATICSNSVGWHLISLQFFSLLCNCCPAAEHRTQLWAWQYQVWFFSDFILIFTPHWIGLFPY